MSDDDLEACDVLVLVDVDGQTRPLAEVEREILEAAIVKATGNYSKASRALGISRNTLYRKVPIR